jgi:hypothetical protein
MTWRGRQAMRFEVRSDGTILMDGTPIARTNNPAEVRRRINRRTP